MNRSILLLTPLFLACSDYSIITVEKGGYTGVDEEETVLESDGYTEEVEEEDDCTENSVGFDIEEVSNLQDAFGLPYVRDGLTLELDLNTDERWRPTNVEVLVMFPDWFYDFYDDSNRLTIHVYDSENPTGSTPYSSSKTIIKSEHTWESILLGPDADWSGSDPQQRGAWIDFDFSSIIPENGFDSSRYFVAVEWDQVGFPYVGYSNFELNCTQNWTDYSDGSWRQNEGQDCSWPMFKIEVERTYEGDCDE
jgi:hypothetical protein